jgi:signal transduction histidine kinase
VAPYSALGVLLLGVGLLVLDRVVLRVHVAEVFALLAGFIAFVAIIGYSFGSSAFYTLGPYRGTSLHTVITIGVVSVGVLFSRPRRGLMALIMGAGPGGPLLRRVIPVVVIIFWAIAWFRLQGELAGLYDAPFGVSLMVTADSLILFVIVVLTSRSLNRVDAVRARAEWAVRESEQRLRLIVSQLPVVTWTMDRDLRVDTSTTIHFGEWEQPADAHKGLTLQESYPDWGEDHPAIQAHRRALQGEAVSVELEVRGRTLMAHVAPFRDSRRDIAGVIGAAVDITDRKQVEVKLAAQAEELARSNGELEQFAYVASHDLQEPLRSIGGFAQLLEVRYKGKLDTDANEFIGYVVAGVARMQAMINDLLAFSRVGTRGKPFALTNLEDVLQEALENLQKSIEESAAVVTREELPIVRGDRSQLVQVFQNLLSNAIKFRGSVKPEIGIDAVSNGKEWTISVRDNGIGIDPKYFHRLFVVFQRLHGRDEYPGTGIGLAICKKIVGRHGGRIWIESKPGSGSTFRFTLPASREDKR